MKFRISTWNCFGMGQGLSAITAVRAPLGDRLRHDEVLSECGEPDILCVQELLSREAQEFFDRVGAGKPTSRLRDDNRLRVGRAMTMRGSGLGILARSPLISPVLRSFTRPGVGWDRLARKGALYAQLRLARGITIDVLTVHLQAGRDAKAVAVRTHQLEDLAAFIRSVSSPRRHCIVCGDFNICGLEACRDSAAYDDLKRAMSGFTDLGAADDLPTIDPQPHGNGLAHALDPAGGVQRLDYIFFRPGRGVTEMHCAQLARFFDSPLTSSQAHHDTSAWASDHYGITATFELA